MKENTDDEQLDNPTNTQSNSPSVEVSNKDQQTGDPTHDTEKLAAHANSHIGKKNWKSYAWEFLMLFLAVTLGFYADNLREDLLSENDVKTHINSLITDLQSDIALFDSVADRNTYSAMMADSLIELLHSDFSNTTEIYFAARAVTINNGFGYSSSKSFDQMKGSGLLKHIKPKALLDSIGNYYARFQWLNNSTELMRLKVDEIHKSNASLFDSYVFQKMKVPPSSFSSGRIIINKPAVKPSLLSKESKDINAVSISYHYYSSTAKFYKRNLMELKNKASALIELIKKEYHIEELKKP